MQLAADPAANFFLVWAKVSTELGGDDQRWARRARARLHAGEATRETRAELWFSIVEPG
jgi:hypothetical protein